MKEIKKIAIIPAVYFFMMVTMEITAVAQEAGTVKDEDGNIYKTTKIGSQIWMAENLKTTKLNDGAAIAIVTEKTVWGTLSTPGYCWYNNDTIFRKTYGALYNGYTVMTHKLCPKEWHVSTDGDWAAMIAFLGGDNIAGGKLKETGVAHWKEPNTGATNETSFTALPGGSRYSNGLFLTIKNLGYWWSPIESNTFNSWYRSMYNKDTAVGRNFFDSTSGFSVRCVKD